MSERQRRGAGGRSAEGYDARGGGAAAGQRLFAAAAAGRLEVTEFQCRRNGKRAKPKCPRGARPRWGGGLTKPGPPPFPPSLGRSPRLPHPPWAGPSRARGSGGPGLPQTPSGASGRRGSGSAPRHIRQVGLTNLPASERDGKRRSVVNARTSEGWRCLQPMAEPQVLRVPETGIVIGPQMTLAYT
ncbi:translation initiation factor IF-2-like [Falco naumanni]|uniref:translation initiation factor IF-2-like n=1 Tax=Falco naumanni TaxID=148594 RepID=UPI001ADE47AA|nr:translation initiation factor IF-2-like [Falco naumanni]